MAEPVDSRTGPRNARAEADDKLADGRVARVLETSPPAVLEGAFSDDPVRTPVGDGHVVAPVGGDVTWAEMVGLSPELHDWAAQRWLVPRPLPKLPPNLVAERVMLHRLATYVVAPARYQVNTKFGLRWTLGGFGTPFFGPDDRQVRVVGSQLVVQQGNTARSQPITSLNAAANFIGSQVNADVASEHDSPPIGDVDEPLDVSAEVVDFLDSWWGMGTAALEAVRADEASIDASQVQLWPGHFDTAIEVGDEDRRGSYGASPGDDGSPDPYLYVSVWWPDRVSLGGDPFWNAQGYVGARMPFAELADTDDPVTAAADFFRTARNKLMAVAS